MNSTIFPQTGAPPRSEPSVHLVHFYDNNAFPDEAIADFLCEGLQAQESAVIIATAEHTAALLQGLATRGAPLERLKGGGRLLTLEAQAIMEQIMHEGLPDRARVLAVLGPILDQAAAAAAPNSKGRIFAEIVALLADMGNLAAALELERLWNELLSTRSFRLHCAYPIPQFAHLSLAEHFRQLCDEHDEVVPVLTWLDRPIDRGRWLAILQQQARALQAEITERKRVEAALQEERALLARRVAEQTMELSAANAELASAARLKDEFLASMSHELRTPLNAILGMNEALQEQLYGSLTEKQRKALRSIEESSHHLLALINDILDLSKIAAGKVELEIAPIAVEAVCQASLRLVQHMAHRKHINLSFSCDSRVTMMAADERRLKQVLSNLLSNAIKFSPENGAVGLEILGEEERKVVRFIVWDTGIGISREDIDRVFQPFVQLDNSFAQPYKGAGLGLALVRNMIEVMGGSITVESELGEGSRFTVQLPWQETEGIPPPESAVDFGAPKQANERRALVLVAEDNESSLDVLSDFLQEKGYRVMLARNGNEVLKRAKEKRPDLVLMDIQMPGMHGFEVMRQMRADEELQTVPIITMTALAMMGDREQCLAAGANEYLSKPLSLKGLIKTIESLLHPTGT